MNPIETYLAECEYRISRNTYLLYKRYLNEFYSAVKFPGDWLSFLRWSSQYKNPRTRHVTYRTVRTFLRWCAANDLCKDWMHGRSLACSKAPAPAVLTTPEFERIIEAIPGSLAGLRDRALFSCLYYSGARRDAIRTLRVQDVDLTERWAHVRTKGNKEMVLTIPAIANNRLMAWMRSRPESEWVFPSMRNPARAVSDAQVTNALPAYAKKAGITRRVWVHLLRHSCASKLAESGVSIEVIQEVLGHSQLATTQEYLRGLNKTQRARTAVDGVFG